MALTRDDLISHLVEQLQFLDASCDSYDRGFMLESKRIAVALRVLFHDTGASHSVLGLLGEKNTMRFPSNLLGVPAPEDPAMTVVQVVKGGLAAACFSLESDESLWVPFYETRPIDFVQSTSFEDWWKTPVMSDATGHSFSRRNFVLIVANKDGGAHVDRSGLPVDFEALTQGSMGWVSDSSQPLQSPAPAALRHIAEEARVAIRHHFGDELGATSATPVPVVVDRGEVIFIGGAAMWSTQPS